MRFALLACALILLGNPFQWGYVGLFVLFGVWDMWDTFRPQPTLIMEKPVEPLVAKVSELLKMRTGCAQANDCKDCKEILQMFMEPHPETPIETPKEAGIPPDSPGLYL